jgi:hypothetical protein
MSLPLLALRTPWTPHHSSIPIFHVPLLAPRNILVEFLDAENDVLKVMAGLRYTLLTPN